MASMPHHIAIKLLADVPGLSMTDASRNLFIGVMPASPAIAVVVRQGAIGRRHELVMKGGGTGVNFEQPLLQVEVRHPNYELGDALAKLVHDSINNFVGVLSGVRYLHILAAHSPSYVGVDEERRHRFSLNFGTRKELG